MKLLVKQYSHGFPFSRHRVASRRVQDREETTWVVYASCESIELFEEIIMKQRTIIV
jgi:hypothetical protein